MRDPEFERWPDGTRVRFTDEAREAMKPRPGVCKPLTMPAAGAIGIYTIDNTEDSQHDVILRETGERYGVFWLEQAADDQDLTAEIQQLTATLAQVRAERDQLIEDVTELNHQIDIENKHANLGSDEPCDVCAHLEVETLAKELETVESERDVLAAKLAQIEALPIGPPSGGFYIVSMRIIRECLKPNENPGIHQEPPAPSTSKS